MKDGMRKVFILEEMSSIGWKLAEEINGIRLASEEVILDSLFVLKENSLMVYRGNFISKKGNTADLPQDDIDSADESEDDDDEVLEHLNDWKLRYYDPVPLSNRDRDYVSVTIDA